MIVSKHKKNIQQGSNVPLPLNKQTFIQLAWPLKPSDIFALMQRSRLVSRWLIAGLLSCDTSRKANAVIMKTHILAGVAALLFVGRAFAPVPSLTKGKRPGRDVILQCQNASQANIVEQGPAARKQRAKSYLTWLHGLKLVRVLK